MQYLTIVENSYEKAVEKAKELYGDNIRVHSRRDFTTQGGLFTRKIHKCEITCYLSESAEKDNNKVQKKDLMEFEKEARTPDPLTISHKERLNTEVHRKSIDSAQVAEEILDKNYITQPLKDKLLAGFNGNITNVPVFLAERLSQLIPISYNEQLHPAPFMVFIGPTGTGKTTTIAKAAFLYKAQGKKVAIITLDSYRVGAYEQIKAFGDVLNIPVDLVKEESELVAMLERFSWYDLVLVDTMGLSNRDKNVALRLKGLTSRLNPSRTSYIFTASPSMKEEDLMEHFNRYRDYEPSAMVCTKLDESETMGNVLAFAYKANLPLLFLTDGQKVPNDIMLASSTNILPYLKGLSFDKDDAISQIKPQS